MWGALTKKKKRNTHPASKSAMAKNGHFLIDAHAYLDLHCVHVIRVACRESVELESLKRRRECKKRKWVTRM